MSETLLSCPFCGGEAETWDGAGPWHVVCTECGTIGSPCLSEAEAIEAWNTRHELTCHCVDVNGYSYRFECSACGYVAIVHNCETRLDELPNYCPNCGAKVVKRDE